ncbi:hypothetical protein [Rickettsiales endosymbiont of Stachyamoeba lipophora]|uniref:hypothetical protein n=1 Tax=Rickettsiales endosymbiont of Stachyamoeba lipophora TaxID=2486578 RepID=UPI000F648BAC|nr:hypothetical protein [Rickettsiales endosymbiont of Stachyamoeba lipophora]AZL16371.1 hypothetical protein EF513_07520 [Rickettsiales endosymbiont of Stachyamoeba lipophora]
MKATLNKSLNIDIKVLSTHMPGLRYRGPIQANTLLNAEAITSEWILNDMDSYKLVLGFEGKTENGFTEIHTHYPPKKLSFFLATVPPEFSEAIKEALRGTALELPSLIEAEKKELEHQALKQKNRKALLQQINSLGQPSNYGNFSSEDARGILLSSLGYTDANSDKPILGIFGAGPVAIAIWNPETKTAALAYINVLTDLKFLDQIFYQLSRGNNAKLQVHLAGGNPYTSTEMVHKIIKRIKTKDNAEIKTSNLIPFCFLPQSLAIDSRNGEIYTKFISQQLDFGKDLHLQPVRLQFSSSPLYEKYDGRGRSAELAKPIKPTNAEDNKFQTLISTKTRFRTANKITELLPGFKKGFNPSL